MITGFNTDIDFSGRVYHVQTEDRGMVNPIVESLVYHGGEIVASRKSPYADLIASNTYSDDALMRRMEAQHKELIREIRSGKFGNDEMLPFGHGIVTNRSLDDVVLAFLQENIALEQLKLELCGPQALEEGARTVELRVIEVTTERPVCGASVAMDWVEPGEAPQTLLEAVTDEDGRVRARVDIPPLSGRGAAIVFRTVAGSISAGLECPVRKKRITSLAEQIEAREPR